MNTIRNIFAKLTSSAPPLPTVSERMAARTSNFQLISLRPYLSVNEKGHFVPDKEKPFVFPAEIRPLEGESVDSAVWAKEKISCADDMCVEAFKISRNMNVVAAGIEITMKEAVMEAARIKEAEDCKYIVFEHPIHKRNLNQYSVVLENTAAPTSDKVLVVRLIGIEHWAKPGNGRVWVV